MERTPKQYANALVDKLESFSDYEEGRIPCSLIRVIAHLSVDMLIQETGKKFYYEVKSEIH
tara:strand:- start:64 stop:246 length:183 start_codon:yes stop_codon:yes gene_type:complete